MAAAGLPSVAGRPLKERRPTSGLACMLLLACMLVLACVHVHVRWWPGYLMVTSNVVPAAVVYLGFGV
eukprot:365771-Chlamydomonas_euryale.AAC.3